MYSADSMAVLLPPFLRIAPRPCTVLVDLHVQALEAALPVRARELAHDAALAIAEHGDPEMSVLAQHRPGARAVLHRDGDQGRLEGDPDREGRGDESVAHAVDLGGDQHHSLREVGEGLTERGIGQHAPDSRTRDAPAHGRAHVLGPDRHAAS